MRQLLKFLSPCRGWLAAALACLTLAAALESIGLSLFVPLIAALTNDTPMPGSGGWAFFMSYVGFLDGLSSAHSVLLIMAGLCAAMVLKHLFAYTGRLLGSYVELRTTRILRQQMFQTYMEASTQFVLDRKQGRLVHDLLDETAVVGEVVAICTGLLSHILTMLMLAVLLVCISWKAAAAAAAMFAVLTIGMQGLARLSKRVGAIRQQAKRDLAMLGTELILGIRHIKVFAAEAAFGVRFQESVRSLSRLNLRMRAIALAIEPLSELAVLSVIVGLVVVGTRSLSGPVMAHGPALLTFAIVLVRLLPVLGSLNKEVVRLHAHAKSIDTVADLLASQPQASPRQPGRRLVELREAIAFDGVSFAYPGRPHALVLRDVTLSIPKGRMTAIVGPSGAGKSTLIDLLIGFYEPSRGRVLLDGADLHEHDIASWRRAIGFVSQDTFIFNDSIWENIAFARSDASEADIRWAAQQADADEFIRQLPHGYETVMGERGLKLSGGQRQRIAIARAILRRPQILIFDEATSALDSESEQRVQRAMRRIGQDRTVVVIAHRLSSVAGAHKIIVLDRGVVVDQGTHQELMQREGLYQRLYQTDALRGGDSEHGEAVEASRVNARE